MAPTIKQIAKLANVSIATVSRALSNDDKVKSETKELVLKAAQQLNYKPNIIARNFVKGKSNIVGLILPDISDEFFSEIIRGVDETFYDNGYYTIVMSSHKNRSLVGSIHTLMSNGLVGGFIILVPLMDKKIEEALKNEQVPFVVIGGDDKWQFDLVTTNNYQAAFSLIEFIIGRGYKKIAHITGPAANNDALSRKKGFIDACSKYEIDIKDGWVVDGDFTIESGAIAAEKILNNTERPEVIFAANDMMALGCYRAIQSKGLKIPTDIAVTGFDDILLSEYVNPSLTTVRVNTDQIGKIAAERLIEKINDIENKPNRKIEVASQLVIRNSC